MSTVRANTILDAAGGTTATVNGYTPTASNMAGRNKIIGGDFTVNPWQRGTTTAVAAAGNTYVADRFKSYNNTDGAYSVIKTADAPTVAEAGVFTQHCLHIDVTTADATIASGQLCQGIIQKIEGYNAASFGFGQSGTRYVTLSFWVKSAKTGTFYVSFINSAANRHYPAQYTISVSNTWEKKIITVQVDTTGTWLYGSGEGLNLVWCLASNQASTGTSNTWGSNASVPNDQVNALDSTSNDFKIALVQLEAGSVATPFEHRHYGTELALCQRYYWVICNGDNQSIANASAFSSSEVDCIIQHPVSMRASPTLSSTNGSAYYNFRSNGGGQTFTTLNLIESNTLLTRLYSSTVSTTSGAAGYLKTNSASAFAALTAEL